MESSSKQLRTTEQRSLLPLWSILLDNICLSLITFSGISIKRDLTCVKLYFAAFAGHKQPVNQGN